MCEGHGLTGLYNGAGGRPPSSLGLYSALTPQSPHQLLCTWRASQQADACSLLPPHHTSPLNLLPCPVPPRPAPYRPAPSSPAGPSALDEPPPEVADVLELEDEGSSSEDTSDEGYAALHRPLEEDEHKKYAYNVAGAWVEGEGAGVTTFMYVGGRGDYVHFCVCVWRGGGGGSTDCGWGGGLRGQSACVWVGAECVNVWGCRGGRGSFALFVS